MDTKHVFDLVIAISFAIAAVAGAYRAKVELDHWRDRMIIRAAKKLERRRRQEIESDVRPKSHDPENRMLQ